MQLLIIKICFMKEAIIFFFLLQLSGMRVFGQVGISTDNSLPDASAILDAKSTNKGALLPRMNRMQRNAIASPADGLMVLCTDCGAGGGAEFTFYSSGRWYIMQKTSEWECGLNITVNHKVAGGVAPVNKSVTYGTTNNIPGEAAKCWITSNLGASQQATAVSDASEASAGWYWQFNRKQGYKHDGSNRTPSYTWDATNDNLSATWEAQKDPCYLELGTAWRIPTYTEWFNVDNTGGWTSWSGPWGSNLKLHAAGLLLYFDGTLFYRGSSGYFWSSTQFTAETGSLLYFTNGMCIIDGNYKSYAYPLRCLREN